MDRSIARNGIFFTTKRYHDLERYSDTRSTFSLATQDTSWRFSVVREHGSGHRSMYYVAIADLQTIMSICTNISLIPLLIPILLKRSWNTTLSSGG